LGLKAGSKFKTKAFRGAAKLLKQYTATVSYSHKRFTLSGLSDEGLEEKEAIP
jgi:hypothetical protein